MLNDVLEALDEAIQFPKKPITYFLGSIVLIKQPGLTDARVIDGQQRLTTLTILLAVLRDLSEGASAENLHKFICDKGNPFTGTESRYYLTLRPRDCAFFRKNIQVLGATTKLDLSRAESDSQKAIIRNAQFYREELVKISYEERDALVKFIMQRCYVVVIAVANVEIAHRVFTVLNARGLDLSPTDILKAELLERAADRERDYSSRWETVEDMLGREKFVDLFQHIRMIYQREKPRERLEVGFPKFVSPFAQHRDFLPNLLEPMAFTFDMLRGETRFIKEFGAEAGKRLAYLNRLDNSDWVPAALKFFAGKSVSKDDALLFMKRLETLAYFLFLRRADINERIARYARVLKELDSDGWHEGAIMLTNDEKAEFKGLLDDKKIYEKTRVRLPLLLRLDSELAPGGVSYDYPVLSIEHVLPQNPSPNSEWLKKFSGEERENWTNKLANLVILTRHKNSTASNLDFNKKKEKYFSGSGGVMPCPVTIQVLNTPNWTPSVLAERQVYLIQTLAASWELDD